MIIKLLSSGKSFAGLGAYLCHDPKAQTANRVAWTYTLNCAHDLVPSALDEFLWTYRDAELLKQDAGIRGGGRPLEKPVKHLSLNWAPDENPSREQMIAATEDFLKYMKWQEHQALLVAHDDKEHHHVHVMLNRVNPTTGMALDDGFEKKRAQDWALEYERSHGKIYCEERLKPVEEREPSPTRPEWLAQKNTERNFEKSEVALRNIQPDLSPDHEKGPRSKAEEWKILKEYQRHEREAYFVDGKSEYKELRKEIYREVREEFREQWAELYQAKRNGEDSDALAEMKAQILDTQNTVFDERRTTAFAELRAERDTAYRELLDNQRDMRANLTFRQEQDLISPDLGELTYGQADGRESDLSRLFQRAAEEVCEQGNERKTREDSYDFEFEWPSATPTSVRPGLDIAGNFGMGMLGGLGAIGESLFDGFFGGGTPPKSQQNECPKPPRPAPEFPRQNPFALAAEEAQQRVERQLEETDRAWWDERYARHRD